MIQPNISEITELNIFISCTEGMFINMSFEKDDRCTVYYCFGTPETREDGQQRHSAESFDILADNVLKFTQKEITAPLPENFKLKIDYTAADGETKIITAIDKNAFMEMLMSIANNFEEFIFVNAFRYYL